MQVGTQQRSMDHFIKAREIVRTGGIGKVHKVHLTWNCRNGDRVKKTGHRPHRPQAGGLEGVPRQRSGPTVRRLPG